MKYVLKNQDMQMFGFKLNKYEWFLTTWSLGRGSETQLHVGENVSTWDKG